MKKEKTKTLIVRAAENSLMADLSVMIICCFAGVIAKKLINPFANVATGFLHVPGGISTAVSLMFLVVASIITKRKWCASAMGIMQAGAALALGSVGSMGMLMPLAYLIPAVVIDIVMLIPGEFVRLKAYAANILSSVSAAVFANLVVFHLPGKALTVYIMLSALTGAIMGFVAGTVGSSFAKKYRK